MAKQKVALVAWELGAGRGHLEHLRPVVAALLADKWTVVAAVRDLKNGHAVFGSIDPVLRHRRFAIGQAPIFLHRATPLRDRPSSLAEILAHAGFASAPFLRPVIETWRQLIEAVNPQVIVGDFSPSVVAASRGNTPVIMTGNGWTIPPDGSPLPPLPIRPYHAAAARDAEDRICSAIEEASDGRWRPARFASLLRGDTNFVYTSALLDPYRDARRDALSWPPNLVIPERREPIKTAHAVLYLPKHHVAIDGVLAALGIVGIETHAYLGGLKPVAPQNVIVGAQPIDLAAMLPGARFMLHHGGLGVANWCMAYQVPQVIIPTDLEKSLIAHAIVANRSGVHVSPSAGCVDIEMALLQATNLRVAATSNGFAHSDPEQTINAIVDCCRKVVLRSD